MSLPHVRVEYACRLLGGENMAIGKLGVAAAVAVVVATPAAAQEGRKLDFGLRASVYHDSNFARSSAAQAAIRGIEPEEMVFSPAATFNLVQPLSRQTVFLNGVVGYDFHRENDRLNRARYALDGGVSSRLGPCSPSVTAAYSHSQSDLRDVTLLDPENVLEASTLGASLACSRGTGLGANVSVTKGWNNNSNIVQEQLDSETSGMSAGLSYSRPALGTLQTFVQYQKVEYPHRLSIPGTSSGYDLWAQGVTFDRKLGARIQGSVSVSHSSVDMSGAAQAGAKNYDGWTYAADVGYRMSSRLNTRLELSRGIVPSTRLGRAYDIRERIGLSGDYQIGSRILLGLGAERVEETFRGAIVTAGPGIFLSNSETNSVYGSLTYRQSERLSFKFNVTQQERETNNPLYNYDSTRIGLTTDVSF